MEEDIDKAESISLCESGAYFVYPMLSFMLSFVHG